MFFLLNGYALSLALIGTVRSVMGDSKANFFNILALLQRSCHNVYIYPDSKSPSFTSSIPLLILFPSPCFPPPF